MIKKFSFAVFFSIACFLIILQTSSALAYLKKLSFNILADIESEALTFLKDSDGFIWIGTYVDGLYRFDGKTLKHYVKASGFILSNNIPAIIEDSDGFLWFAAAGGGLTRYDKETNKTVHFIHKPDEPASLSSNNFFWAGKNLLTEDKKGFLWIGTIGGGLNSFNKKTHEFVHFTHDTYDDSSLSSDNVRALFNDSKGRIWAGTEKGLNVLNKDDKTFTRLKLEPEIEGNQAEKIIMSIYEDSFGSIWIGTENNGLYRYDETLKTVEHFSYEPGDAKTIGSNRVNYIIEDETGLLWVSHENKFSLFDPVTEFFYRYEGELHDITMSFTDKTTSLIWGLTDTGKVVVHNPDENHFKQYGSDNKNSLSSEVVVSIYEDNKGILWISTLKGLNRFDPAAEEFTHFFHEPGNPESIPSTVDYSPGIHEDKDHVFWIGSSLPSALSIFDTDTGKVVKTYYPDPSDPSAMPDAQQINKIIDDGYNPDLMWLSTAKGLVCFNKKTEKFKTFGDDNSWDLFEDKDGFIWFSTWGRGLGKFDKKTENFEYLSHDPDNPESISDNLLIPLFTASDDSIWIGTENGLNLLDKKRKTFKSFRRDNGYPFDAVHSIGEDKNKNLWLGTNAGLVQFKPSTFKTRVFTKKDGVESVMFYANNGITSKSGEMWFGGTKGMVSFFPDQITLNQHIPDIKLSTVKQGGEIIDFEKAPERLKTITLDWKNNFFEFEFVAFDYTAPEKNEYAYILEGLDKQWFYSGNKNWGRYSGLTPGQYQLRLKGSNNDGIWNEKGTSVKVIVLSPFWKTPWFYSLMVLLAVFIISAIIKNQKKLKDLAMERLESQKAFSESEKQYQDLFNNLVDVFYRTDIEGRLVLVSPSFEKMFGYTTEEAVGMNVAADLYVVPKHREELIRQLNEKGMVEGFEVNLKKKDGTPAWIATSARIYYDDQKKPAGVEGILRDITLQKQAEMMRDLLSTVIEQASELIIITNTNGDILYVNPAFENETGYKKKEILGKNPNILKSGKHGEAYYQNLWETISRGEIWKGRITNKRKDSSFYEEDATITPVKDIKGNIINYVGIKRDVTKEIRLEKQLFQAQKMESIGTLAGGIAHDFNNILSAIMGYTQISLMDIQDAKIKKNLKKVLKAGNRAKDLVNQILTFSRQSEIKPRSVIVKNIVKEVIKLLRASLPSTIEIKQNINSNSSVMADPTQIHQILMNLCTNAGYAMQEKGGTLTIELIDADINDGEINNYPGLTSKKFIKIRVSDTGSGMSQDVSQKIFDPFYTTKEKGHGTGMGLSVVHGIVKRYKGLIKLNTQLGKGSIFSVYLPAFESGKSHSSNSEDQLLFGSERILFIDDEAFQTDLGKQLLEKLGYRVSIETDSVKALERFKQDPTAFDLIITDMTMPKLPGDQLSRKILSIRPDIPIILCTGYSEHITREKALKIGIKGYITKPILLNKMSKTIRKALEDTGSIELKNKSTPSPPELITDSEGDFPESRLIKN